MLNNSMLQIGTKFSAYIICKIVKYSLRDNLKVAVIGTSTLCSIKRNAASFNEDEDL